MQVVDFKSEGNWARAALRTMAQHGIPANPRNYTVWYAYHSSRQADLTRTLDLLLENKPEFTDACNEELYEKFFGIEAGFEEIDRTSREIAELLDQTRTAIGEAGQSASHYGQKLVSLSGDIAQAADGESLRALINGMVLETRRMQTRNQQLEQRLNRSSEKIRTLNDRLESVKREAMTDALTGLANRKGFEAALKEATKLAAKARQPLSLLFIDIDHFKAFNDNHGHQLGDQVIKLVGQVLAQSFKGRDTAARYGGEEFAVVLPRTAPEDAFAVAEQVRSSLADRKLTKRRSGEILGQITLSIGIAGYRPGEPLTELLDRADVALYEAKRGGRNRVVIETTKAERAAS